MRRERRPGSHLAVALVATLMPCLATAACSAGPASHPSGHNRSPNASPSAQASAGPGAQAAVKAMWQKFFNGAVPIPRRLPLLQDSGAFTTFVKAEEKTSVGALVLAASAKVSSVTLGPPGRASVRFTVLLGGKPLAKNLSGTAVYAGGRWQVADATFCGLLRKAYGKKSHQIPAACGS